MLKTKGFIEPKGSKRDFEGVRRISLATLPRYGRMGKTKGFIEPKGSRRRNGWMGGGIQMHLVLYHQQTTRKKGHHDSWHFLCASLTVYVSSLHL